MDLLCHTTAAGCLYYSRTLRSSGKTNHVKLAHFTITGMSVFVSSTVNTEGFFRRPAAGQLRFGRLGSWGGCSSDGFYDFVGFGGRVSPAGQSCLCLYTRFVGSSSEGRGLFAGVYRTL